jgi:hypothetical protein
MLPEVRKVGLAMAKTTAMIRKKPAIDSNCAFAASQSAPRDPSGREE